MFELLGVMFDKVETKNGSKLIIREGKDGEPYIVSMLLKDVVLSYQYLTRPRPKAEGASPDEKDEFGADLIIFDEETRELMLKYFRWDIVRVVGPKPSKNFKLSVREPKEDSKAEEGAVAVVSVKTYNRIPMYDTVSTGGMPIDVSKEEDLDAYIYSGAVVDAVIASYVWNNKFGQGLKPYINAVSRTGEGQRLEGANINYVELFSGGDVVFGKSTDTVVPEKDKAENTPKAEEDKTDSVFSMDNLMSGSTKAQDNSNKGGFDLASLLKK